MGVLQESLTRRINKQTDIAPKDPEDPFSRRPCYNYIAHFWNFSERLPIASLFQTLSPLEIDSLVNLSACSVVPYGKTKIDTWLLPKIEFLLCFQISQFMV